MARNTLDSNKLRQVVFIAIIIILGIVLFNQLSFFIPSFLGAVTFYVLMRERMFYLVEKKKWKKGPCRLGIDATFIFCDIGTYWSFRQYHLFKNQLPGRSLK